MAVNSPPNVLTSGASAPPVPWSQVVYPRDIARAQNVLTMPVPGSRTLFVYQRASAPVILGVYFTAGGAPFITMLQRSRSPHVLRLPAPVDHISLTLASLLGTTGTSTGQAGISSIPAEGSSLLPSIGQFASTPRGDGYVLISGLDQIVQYDQPKLDVTPRYMIPFNGTVGAVGVVAIGPGAIPITVTRVDLFNEGVAGTNATLNFLVQGYDLGGTGFSNNLTAGSLSASGSGNWNLEPGRAESVDIDNAPGSSMVVTVNNNDATKSGLYVVNVWGY